MVASSPKLLPVVLFAAPYRHAVVDRTFVSPINRPLIFPSPIAVAPSLLTFRAVFDSELCQSMGA